MDERMKNYWAKQMVESVTKKGPLITLLESNMPPRKPEPWYGAFWRGFCTPFRAMQAFWLVASGQGYVRRYEDDEEYW